MENFWFIVATRSADEAEIRTGKAPAEQVLKDTRRQTRRQYAGVARSIAFKTFGAPGRKNDATTSRPK